MIAVIIRQFHDSMRARARMDDTTDIYRNWFPVAQRLCAIPAYVQHFFAVAIEVSIVRLSKDDAILQTMVYLEVGANAGGVKLALLYSESIQ